jgi:quercetin dioxygenase-like cupin family protein
MYYRLLIPFVLFPAMLAAEPPSAVEIASEPHHHLVLLNQYVRVFKVEVPPRQSTMMHWHGHDYAYVTIGNAEFSNELMGKQPVTVKLQNGETRFFPGNFAHVARDLASTPFRNVTIEFLQDQKARQTPSPKWDEQRGLQVLEAGTADILFVKDGVRLTDFQLQPGATVPKNRLSAPYLLVAVTDLELRAPNKATLADLKSGSVKWFAAGHQTGLVNTAKQPARFIALEF